MKNGFIFTIDAFYAMIFVVSLAGAFAFYYTAAPTNSKEIETLNMKTTDTALVAFYLGKSIANNPADFPGFQETLSTDANFSKCVSRFYYPISRDQIVSQTPITEYKFCKRIR